MGRTITYSETLETTVCWCGINYAVPENLLRHAHNDAQTIYCPLGHTVVWRETEAKRLKKELERVERVAANRLARADQLTAEVRHQEAVAAGYKGALTKAKKRIGKGVCPCCNRHFANVERHMATQHPDLAE